METIEVYAYCAKGLAGAPATEYGLHLTGKQGDVSRPIETWEQKTYWALSAYWTFGDGTSSDNVLMHIYYEGPLPDDRLRDDINKHVKSLTDNLLFNQER